MTNYRRIYFPGATWFFTVNLAERKGNSLLVDRIDVLRESFIQVRNDHTYQIDAIVILPDHLHSTCMDATTKGWSMDRGRATQGAVAEYPNASSWRQEFFHAFGFT